MKQVEGLLPLPINDIGTDSDLDGIEIPNDLLEADQECIEAPSITILQIVNDARKNRITKLLNSQKGTKVKSLA